MSTRTLFTIAAVVVLGLICFAQSEEGAGQAVPTQVVPAQGEVLSHEERMRRHMEAIAAARGQPQVEQGARGLVPVVQVADNAETPSYRLQLILLCINEDADESKLAEIRATAQSNEQNNNLFEIADELVSNGSGVVIINPVLIVPQGHRVTSRIKSQSPSSFTEKLEGKEIKYTTMIEDGFQIMADASRDSIGKVTIQLDLNYSYGPRGSADRVIPSERTECQWSGIWKGSSSAQVVLMADTPRRTGKNAAIKRPPERYLLMRIDTVE